MNKYNVSIIPHTLTFKQPAGTSRGVYRTRKVWYVLIQSIEEPDRWGIGECAPLPDLSCDALSNYEYVLATFCRKLETDGMLDVEALRPYPSMLFGLETALLYLRSGSFKLIDSPFSKGEQGIPINGLIWMGSYEQMLLQIKEKLAAGFRCVKLKIGAINFDEELALLSYIRKQYPPEVIELRVDANGAFDPADAMEKLSRLAELGIHSIEQPIKAGQWDEMARLTAGTPLPIALDEELIGIHTLEEKCRLLNTINPQYIILKPSLHGGISGCKEWIDEAEKRNIGWWITSALESNIGLNAIAQWSAPINNPLPQGLGTGKLFVENINLPLAIRKDCLWFDAEQIPSDVLSGIVREGVQTDTSCVTLKTSGSTGTPKTITVRRQQMLQSARFTCDRLGLKPGDKALLCMPVEYIAGKMMEVRAMVAGLQLIVRKPSGHPLADVEEDIHFAAMTPMQVYNTLKNPVEAERLRRIPILIIGGAAIDPALEQELQTLPGAVYSTYGMTETLSHIALRRLNGDRASFYYIPFPSVKLSRSAEDTLIIDAPLISDNILYTNDIVELLPDGRFKVRGRKDNVINSGGIKLQIEEIEHKLKQHLSGDFAITSIPDPRLGEAVVLLSVQPVENWDSSWVGKYEQPKHVFLVERIPLTLNGKVDRRACRELAWLLHGS